MLRPKTSLSGGDGIPNVKPKYQPDASGGYNKWKNPYIYIFFFFSYPDGDPDQSHNLCDLSWTKTHLLIFFMKFQPVVHA